MQDIDRRVERTLAGTRAVRVSGWVIFMALFGIAPIVTWWLGFAQIGLLLIIAFAILNGWMAIVFIRAHRRIDRDDGWHRWTHAIVMLAATPSAIRASDQATRHALREFDPLAVAARLVGEEDAAVRTMLRELAHPSRGLDAVSRQAAARRAGLRHVDQPPQRSGDAIAYCPRCLVQYSGAIIACADCEIPLREL